MDASYAGVRAAHVAFVALSIALFLLRMAWRERAPARLARGWVKVVPHVVDTALLLSGAWLAWQLGGAGVRGWLPAKLVGLGFYADPQTNWSTTQKITVNGFLFNWNGTAWAAGAHAVLLDADEEFDPSEHTVAEVQQYLDEHHDEADAVLAAEATGKNRTTLTGS